MARILGKSFVPLLLLSLGIWTATASSAAAAEKSYLMWQMPTKNISFPIYVYEKSAQVGYIYSASQQAFIGSYGSSTSGTYDLFYADSSGSWYGCTVVLSGGKIDARTTTCPGAVVNPPAESKSNVYTLALAAIAWNSAAAPASPTSVNYAQRTITFVNKTRFAELRIGQHCTVSANPDNKACQNKSDLFEIAKGESKIFYVNKKSEKAPPNGTIPKLESNAFTVTAYKVKSGDDWVPTGGYGVGEQPYATKIEFTHKTVNVTNGIQTPTGATNFDISAVDGYNIRATGYPGAGTYCTYTVPPESSNVLGAGKYDHKAPLAKLLGHETLCAKSSQLPEGYTGKDKPWNLLVTSAKGEYRGCMSPCRYATANGSSDQDKFCCTGSYGTAATCDQKSGTVGANTSSYVTELAPPESMNVYRFAYDDAIGDFACPAQTDFVIEFDSPEPA